MLAHIISLTLTIGIILIPIVKVNFLFDSFVVPKFIVTYAICLLASIFLIIQNKKINLKIPNTIGKLLLVTTITYFFSFLFYPAGNYGHNIFESILYLFIFTCSMYAASNNYEKFLKSIFIGNLISSSIVVLIILTSIIQKNENSFDLFFGNRNHLAEFLGISIIFHIFYLIDKNLKNILLIVTTIVLILISIYLCFLTNCRSVLLSLLICLVLYIIHLLPKIYKIISSVLLLIVLIYGSFLLKNYIQKPVELGQIKQLTLELRLIKWQNTLKMYFDNPMGIGPNNFEFIYLDYKSKIKNDFEVTEKVIIKSPHNGYLELFTEYGTLFGLFTIILIIYLLFLFYQMREKLYFYFLIFFSINAFFAFPMELPFSSYAFVIIIGLAIGRLNNQFACINFSIPKSVLRIISIALFFCSLIFIGSLANSNYYSNDKLNNLFCKLTPSIWRNCINYAVNRIENKDYKTAAETLDMHLKNYPNSFLALRLAAFSNSKIGNISTACEYLKKYDSIFNNSSSIHQIYINQCQLIK